MTGPDHPPEAIPIGPEAPLPVAEPAEPPKPRRAGRRKKPEAEPAIEQSDLVRAAQEALGAEVVARDQGGEEFRRSTSYVIDEKHGIRIEKELQRQRGQVHPRVLVRFVEKPNDEERQILKDEGFRWDGDESAWTAKASAANVHLAREAVSDILKMRGAQPLYLS